MAAQQRRFGALPSTEPGAVAGGPSVTDALIGVPPQPPPVPAPAPPPRLREYERPPSRSTARRQAAKAKKETLRQNVDRGVMNRLRGAVAACKYRDPDRLYSMNVAMEVAVREFVERTEDQYNGGEPFPWTEGDRL